MYSGRHKNLPWRAPWTEQWYVIVICPPSQSRLWWTQSLGRLKDPSPKLPCVVIKKPRLPSGWQLSGLWPWWRHRFGMQSPLSTARLSCWEDPCCSRVGKTMHIQQPVSNKLASFQKHGEGAMKSLDCISWWCLFEMHVFLPFVPGNVYIFINFVSWSNKNVVSGEVDFVVTECKPCTSVGVVT